jgi:signal transduction histidine kinase/CheY-like chemotaxis protein
MRQNPVDSVAFQPSGRAVFTYRRTGIGGSVGSSPVTPPNPTEDALTTLDSLRRARPATWSYAGALLAVLAATLVRAALTPALGFELPYTPYFAPFFFAAWRLGFGPTIVVTLLSGALAQILFLPPAGGGVRWTRDLIGLALFLGIGLATAVMARSRTRALQRAEAEAAEARRLQRLAEESASEAEEYAMQAEEEAVRARQQQARADTEASRAASASAQHEETRAQLLHAQQIDTIGRLAGGVAHDFNNILTAIAGYCGLLLGALAPSDPRRADVDGIQEAVDRAAALTQQLLAFGRKQVIQPEVLDVREVVDDTGRMLRRLIGEHIDLALSTGPLLSPVLADRAQLAQVLINLAVNARDAMPSGGRLTIEAADAPLTEEYAGTHLAVAPGHYVRLAVTDTGHGMTPEVRAHIFEPFFTTKPPGKGTGLGLSTVYGIVKQLGGHIFVYTEPRHGTTFRVYLPRSEEAARPRAQRDASAETHGSGTILLVEDDWAARLVATRLLEIGGYTVLVAEGPVAALDIARGHDGPIHLLLTDLVMPDMRGDQLAEHVARLRPGLRVLFMSGYTQEAVIHQGRMPPGMHLLQKPFTPEQLRARVRQLLHGDAAPGAPGAAGAAGAAGAG